MTQLIVDYAISARPGHAFDVYLSLQHKKGTGNSEIKSVRPMDNGIKSIVPYSVGYNIKISVNAIDEKGLENLEETLKADSRITKIDRLEPPSEKNSSLIGDWFWETK